MSNKGFTKVHIHEENEKAIHRNTIRNSNTKYDYSLELFNLILIVIFNAGEGI